MSAPLFVAHDALLGVDVSQPVDREEAGRLATAASIAAGNRGERVATDDGRDRFTVRPAPYHGVNVSTVADMKAACGFA